MTWICLWWGRSFMIFVTCYAWSWAKSKLNLKPVGRESKSPMAL